MRRVTVVQVARAAAKSSLGENPVFPPPILMGSSATILFPEGVTISTWYAGARPRAVTVWLMACLFRCLYFDEGIFFSGASFQISFFDGSFWVGFSMFRRPNLDWSFPRPYWPETSKRRIMR